MRAQQRAETATSEKGILDAIPYNVVIPAGSWLAFWLAFWPVLLAGVFFSVVVSLVLFLGRRTANVALLPGR